MKILLLAILLAIASSAPAAPYNPIMVDTNGVQRSPAMLTLTNVVIQGFAFEDLADVDISARSIGDVPTWDGTNYVFTAPGGHDPVTQGEGDIGTLIGQVRSVTTNQVRAAAAGAFVNLSSGGTVTNVDAQIVLPGGSSYLAASSGAFQTGLSVNANPVLTTADTLDADTFNAQAAPYYLAFSNHTGTVTSAQILDATVAPADLSTSVRTITVPVGPWKGPRDTEIPGWATKSYASTNTTTRLCEGVVNLFTTQYAATLDAEFTTPPESTAWAATPIVLKLLGDSTTSSDVKYSLSIFRDGTLAAIYTSANQVLTSTTGISTVSISSASLGTFSAGKTYTIRLEPSVRYNAGALGLYVHSLTVQVLK